MGADLMRIASARSGFDFHIIWKTADHSQFGQRGFSSGYVCDRSVTAITIHAQGEIRCIFLPYGAAGSKGQVRFVDLAFCKLGVQLAVGFFSSAEPLPEHSRK